MGQASTFYISKWLKAEIKITLFWLRRQKHAIFEWWKRGHLMRNLSVSELNKFYQPGTRLEPGTWPDKTFSVYWCRHTNSFIHLCSSTLLQYPWSYLERFDLILESLVLRLQVLHTMFGLAQLCFQLSLQLPAPLLKLQQLLLSLLAAADRTEGASDNKSRQKEVGMQYKPGRHGRWVHSETVTAY